MLHKNWRYEETELTIKADNEQAINSVIKTTLKVRHQIERFVIRNPEFRESLNPIKLEDDEYPEIINMMLRASEIAETGPFSAVAGSISQLASEAGVKFGSGNVLVDNGGDISIIGEKDFNVGIHAGASSLSGGLALSLKARDLPIGICTSSSSVGHSMSFGNADAVVIVAKEASIADAVATAVANEVKGGDTESSINNGLGMADDIPEINGCIIIKGSHIGMVGRLPKIKEVMNNEKKYSK